MAEGVHQGRGLLVSRARRTLRGYRLPLRRRMQEAGACELMTPTAASPGFFFPVRALYVELATLQTAQSTFTEERWRKACQAWNREQRRAAALYGWVTERLGAIILAGTRV